MITIIAGTNRPFSKSGEIARYYTQLLDKNIYPSQILDLVALPPDFTHSALYDKVGKNEQFNALHRMVEESDKLVFIVPEYNNSFPGVLKTFLDGLKYPGPLLHKKCALVGLSSGPMGNALGLSHLTDILHYLGAQVIAQKVRIPFMQKNFSEGVITDSFIAGLMQEQATLFTTF